MGRKRLKGKLINLKNNRHSYYNLKYNLILVTKDNRECINKEMEKKLDVIFKELVENKNGSILDFHSRANFIYLYFELPVNLNLADFLTNLKTVSSRLIRRDFKEYLKGFYENGGFWSENYCIFTERDKFKEYIEEFFSLV
ncbi:IS200/IS605 family transposase [uncultured Fusobacterium sp.]|uniref:IS200/IS605 family transposase n=1 Tax=uncultured Fusobacterium sp. TaxID=159267 RepID=UPI0025E2734A|nr:IS200/IS605 family transposase [uncultured Fusobacterium sp.]